MTVPLLGIDLNGLCDVSVTDVETGVLRGGSVPSVLVVQPRQKIGDALRVIAGTEAAMAFTIAYVYLMSPPALRTTA